MRRRISIQEQQTQDRDEYRYLLLMSGGNTPPSTASAFVEGFNLGRNTIADGGT